MSEVAQIIAEEIRADGAITFRRFMELALYCPVCGYYEKEGDNIGARGDFYTSVSVGNLFGEMLAFQFAEWLEEQKAPEDRMEKGETTAGAGEVARVVEGGAHRGELAASILNWLLRERPEVFARLEYWIVEPSERRREWQRIGLSPFQGKVRWAETLSELAGVRGVIFSNELLDAMPVQRLGWDASRGCWFEWGVRMQGERFEWTRMEVEEARSEARSAKCERAPGSDIFRPMTDRPWPVKGDLLTACGRLENVLPDGFTVEICPAAEEWWSEAAGVLNSGRLMTIDYGSRAEELLLPERTGGTLRAYRQHRASRDVLREPGEQDLTAHVNFTAIEAAGTAAGLETEAEATQAQFLTKIAARIWAGDRSFGEWTAERTRQFQTLTHPECMGQAFRVLVQRRAERLQPWGGQSGQQVATGKRAGLDRGR